MAIQCQAADYVISVNYAYAEPPRKEAVKTLFNAIYAPLGIKPSVQFLPSKRGLFLANTKQVDAEAGRTLKVAAQYPNLVVVPESLITQQTLYFCLKKADCAKSETLRYALIRGFEAGKAFCDINGLDCLYEQSPTFLSTAFATGAIDTLIGSHSSAAQLLCQSELEEVFYRVESSLDVVSYHLIHKSHNSKVEKLAEAIRRVKQNGILDQFVTTTTTIPKACPITFLKVD